MPNGSAVFQKTAIQLGKLGHRYEASPAEGAASSDCVSMSKQAGRQFVAVDDLPVAIPVTVRELELIESYLGDALDELFADPPFSKHRDATSRSP